MTNVLGAKYQINKGWRQERRKPKSRYALLFGSTLALAAAILGANQVFHFGIGHSASGEQAQSRLVAAVDARASAPAPTKKPAVASTENVQATAAVQAIINQSPTQTWSVAVYDVASRAMLVNINAQQQMTAAGSYDLFTAFALAQQVPFAQWATVQVDGQSLESCVGQMLSGYGADCSAAIQAYIGTDSLNAYIHGAGFTGTTTSTKLGLLTSPYDTSRFMAQLYQGKLFSPAATAFVLNSLQHQVYRSGLPAGCPDCTVYDKSAPGSQLLHDSAIVVSGTKTYAVSVMTQGGAKYAQLAALESALQTALTTP